MCSLLTNCDKEYCMCTRVYQKEVSVLNLRAVAVDLAHRAEHAQPDARLEPAARLRPERARARDRPHLRVALLVHRHIRTKNGAVSARNVLKTIQALTISNMRSLIRRVTSIRPAIASTS